MKYKIFMLSYIVSSSKSCLQAKQDSSITTKELLPGGCTSSPTQLLCGFVSCPPSSSPPRRWCPRHFYLHQRQVPPLKHYHPARRNIPILFSILGNAPSVITPITRTSLTLCFVPITTKKTRTLGQTSAWYAILSIVKSAWNRYTSTWFHLQVLPLLHQMPPSKRITWESGIVMNVTTRIIRTSPLQYFVIT